jgi:hypothetical protein
MGGTTGGGTITTESAKKVVKALGEGMTEKLGRMFPSDASEQMQPPGTAGKIEVLSADGMPLHSAPGDASPVQHVMTRDFGTAMREGIVTKDIAAQVFAKLKHDTEAWDKAGLMLADLDTLRARFLPGEGEVVTEDEFIQRGADLVAVSRNSFVVLGELLDWKMSQEQCEDEISRNALVERYAPAWGVSTSGLWKAWVYANRFPGLMLPEDTSQTLAYEVMSGCATRAEAEEVLNLALAQGWSVRDVREIKNLRSRGLLEDWVRLKLAKRDGILQVIGPTGPVGLAAYFECHEGDEGEEMLRAGIALLEMRAGL